MDFSPLEANLELFSYISGSCAQRGFGRRKRGSFRRRTKGENAPSEAFNWDFPALRRRGAGPARDGKRRGVEPEENEGNSRFSTSAEHHLSLAPFVSLPIIHLRKVIITR